MYFGQFAQPQPEAPPHFLKPFWNAAAWVRRNGSQQSQENNTLLSSSHTTDWFEEQQLQCVHGEVSGNRPERRGSYETNKTVTWQRQVDHRSPIGISNSSGPSDWEPGGKLGQLWQTPMNDLSRMPRNQLSSSGTASPAFNHTFYLCCVVSFLINLISPLISQSFCFENLYTVL